MFTSSLLCIFEGMSVVKYNEIGLYVKGLSRT
jgi:hypothetical protein